MSRVETVSHCHLSTVESPGGTQRDSAFHPSSTIALVSDDTIVMILINMIDLPQWPMRCRLMCKYSRFLGSITLEDILTVYPFGTPIELVQITGQTLKDAFEHSVSNQPSPTTNNGRFLQASGKIHHSQCSTCFESVHDPLRRMCHTQEFTWQSTWADP